MPKDSLTMKEALANFPRVPRDMVEALELVFPDKLPSTRVSPEDLAFLQGQQKVVQFLRAKCEEQLYNLSNKVIKVE